MGERPYSNAKSADVRLPGLWDIDDRVWFREGGFSGLFGLREDDCCCAAIVASDPFADSEPMSRTVAGDRGGDTTGAARLEEDRLGSAASSTIFDFVELRLAVRAGMSLSWLDRFVLEDGVSARIVLLVLDSSSLLDRRLDDDLVDSALIRILAFPSFGFSLSSLSPTVLPLREF